MKLTEQQLREIEVLSRGTVTAATTQGIIDLVARIVKDELTRDFDKRFREVQEVIGPHGAVSRLQAGGVRIARGTGIGVYEDGVQKTTIDIHGNIFAGDDITNPSSTTFSVFTTPQSYQGEEMGGGDLLIGDNAAGNVKYDAGEGQLQFREGTTIGVYMDTDGSIKAGGGNVTIDADGITFANGEDNQYLVLKDSNGDPTMFIVSTTIDDLTLNNTTPGKAVRLYVDTTDSNGHPLTWAEDGANANVTQLNLEKGAAGVKLSLDGSVIIWAAKDGTTTVFNEDSFDIDFRIESATNANAFWLDAGTEAVYLFGNTGATSIATFDNGTDKRLEIGADHYIPTRDSSNPNVYFNEAGQDMDVIIKDASDNEIFHSDAGAGKVTFKTGYLTPWQGHGLSATIAAGATMYAPFYGLAGGGLNATSFNAMVKSAGKMSRLSVRLITAQPGTGSLVLTLRVNNVDTALVLTIPAGSAGATTYSETSTLVDVAVDDLIIIKIVNNAAAASGQIGIVTIVQSTFDL